MVRAALAHLNLTMVHPFKDGNGRMARAIQTLVLAHDGILEPIFCSIEEWLGRNTQAYYEVLANVGHGSWHPEHDALPWIRFCLVAHYQQAATLIKRQAEVGRIWDEIETLAKRHALPDRAQTALMDAAFGYKVRNSLYRGEQEISDVKSAASIAGRSSRPRARAQSVPAPQNDNATSGGKPASASGALNGAVCGAPSRGCSSIWARLPRCRLPSHPRPDLSRY